MKKRVIFCILLLTVLFTAGSISAEIYKYIDKNGQKRWTDDINQIPPSQRDSVETMDSVQSAPESNTGQVETNVPPADSSAESAPLDAATGTLDREALEKEKAALDALYQALLTEQKALEQMKTETLDAATQADLNKRINAFNNKTEQYKTQLDQFNKKIEVFNQQIMSNQPSPSNE